MKHLAAVALFIQQEQLTKNDNLVRGGQIIYLNSFLKIPNYLWYIACCSLLEN